MFRKILLIFLFCGLMILSVALEYRATAGASTCPSPRGLCVPVEPPACERPDCEVVRPLLHASCKHKGQPLLIVDTIQNSQDCVLCLEIINSQQWRNSQGWRRCSL